MTRQNPSDRLPARRSLFFGAAVAAALLGLLTLNGCQSQDERRGVSRLPVNRPSAWEGRGGYVEGDL